MKTRVQKPFKQYTIDTMSVISNKIIFKCAYICNLLSPAFCIWLMVCNYDFYCDCIYINASASDRPLSQTRSPGGTFSLDSTRELEWGLHLPIPPTMPHTITSNSGQNILQHSISMMAYHHHHWYAVVIWQNTTPQPFYGHFSGTTRVSQCQKRTSGLYSARED